MTLSDAKTVNDARTWLIAEIEREWDDERIVAAFRLHWGETLSEADVRRGIAYTRNVISRRPKYCQTCGHQLP